LSEILSQAEIDALLNSLSGANGTDAPGGPPKPSEGMAATSTFAPPPRSSGGMSTFLPPIKAGGRTVAYEVYDFRRPDKLSKDQLRTLQQVNETFARLMGSTLSAYLRTQVQIDLVALEQVPYEDYLRGINHSVFTIMSLPPLTGQAVLEMEFGLVFTMIDRMLGGPGKPIGRTNLTDIERPLLRQTIERMFAALKTSWEGVVMINPTVEGTESSAQFVQVAPPTDVAVTILFEVRMGGARHAMSLCIPYSILKPITSKLSAQKWFAGATRKATPTTRLQLSQQVQDAKIDLSVCLGETTLSMGDFVALRPGDTIRLSQPVAEPLVLNVGGVPKFAGRPALQGRKIVFAVVGRTKETPA
jgi:flagellar motor switch protein FliM